MDRKSDASLDATATSADLSRGSSSSFAEEEGRFVPGTLLGGRYRILGLLGRGGMGEVYRATDLTLGQSVALKFLPEEAARNQRLLERFHGEVRVARQVSHPNVCRVYDIGEAEGMPFISMEYVDGEDFASLLPRIGRLPADKALEAARKICAGLAAAHDKGIVHRDLKPHNIMMNKRGEVVIMDFGLAAIADQLSGVEARNGTPAYMAPEQLKGGVVTARSDIYALGLVLYELFTGKRPYEAKSLQQLMDMQDSAQVPGMSTIAPDVEPAVERVIRRCLNPDPAARPPSALSVAAALPGGDPLAAALAAGETPSPELVAKSGETEGLARGHAAALLVAVVACLLGAIAIKQYSEAIMHAPAELSPEVLAQKAREVAVAAGFARKPVDSAVWMWSRGPLLDQLARYPAPRKWEEWLAAEGPLMARYRESQAAMLAEPFGYVSRENPPLTEPGMVWIAMDSNGRLREFLAVPYDGRDAFSPPAQPEVFFRAAGLDLSKFHEAEPVEMPAYASDTLSSWRGPHPVLPDTEMTVDMAVWKGRVTMFKARLPWVGPVSAPGPRPYTLSQAFSDLPLVFIALFLVFLVLMARHNWKLGRMDRRGAVRLAAARFLLAVAAWVGTVHAAAEPSMAGIFWMSLKDWVFSGAIVWLLYIALEPAVRAHWPHAIVTWNRLLAGHWRDAQVNAHVLAGAAAGTALWVGLSCLGVWRDAGALGGAGDLAYALGARHTMAAVARNLGEALISGLVVFFAIFGLRRVLRNNVLAALAASVVFTILRGEVLNSPDWPVQAAIYLVLYGVLTFVLLRYGLVVTMSAMFFLNMTNAVSVGADLRAWFAPYGLAILALLLAIATFAFWRSLGSRGLLEEALNGRGQHG